MINNEVIIKSIGNFDKWSKFYDIIYHGYKKDIDFYKIIWKDRFRIAFIYKREFELLLRLAGFKKWKVYGDSDYKPLKSSNQRMFWVVQ